MTGICPRPEQTLNPHLGVRHPPSAKRIQLVVVHLALTTIEFWNRIGVNRGSVSKTPTRGRKMKDSTRRAVAYLAGIALSGENSSAVFDYSNSRYFSFSSNFSSSQVSAYDHSERCHISGSKGSNSMALYHYGNQRHINLNITLGSFQGYDYDSGCHFSGTVNGRAVSLYDYERGGYFNYAI